MGNLQSLSDLTRLMQDVQYTAALRGMTPEQKKNYFESQKNEYMNNLLNQRESNFQKVHTDAVRNDAIQNSFFYYLQRNRDLAEVGDYLKSSNESNIGAKKYNNQLALRQNEINEWAANDKMDTIFVFQILFVTILAIAGLTYLQRAGFFSQALLGLLAGIFVFIDVVVIVNRSLYTKKTRNQRYWNRREFPKKDLPFPGQTPDICPPAEEEEQEGFADVDDQGLPLVM